MPAKVIAILTADIHLQHNPPPARARESNWYVAQARPLNELAMLAADYKCPIICAGDVVNTWYEPAELISFAIEHLPQPFYSIRGNHDLPYHNHGQVGKSAYHTLCVAGVVRDLQGEEPWKLSEDIFAWAYPYGCPLKAVKINPSRTNAINLAVVHDYLWTSPATGHKDAPADKLITARRRDLVGYDVALFGDNHKPFDTRAGGCAVINAGSLIRRFSDEIDHKPSIGLLWSDGKVTRHYLDISKDVFDVTATSPAAQQALTPGPDMRAFLTALAGLGGQGFDFKAAAIRWLEENPLSPPAAKLLLESLENRAQKVQ